MNHLTDPQGLAYEGRPYDQRTVEIMEWLASPDGGALRTDQACHIAREIAHGRVPHVSMEQAKAPPLVIDIQPAMMTVDGGRTWTTIPAGIADDAAMRSLAHTVAMVRASTEEDLIKAALIKIGWTPPEVSK